MGAAVPLAFSANLLLNFGRPTMIPAEPPQPAHAESVPSPEVKTAASTALSGITCFRGNEARNHYGEGPVPTGHLRVRWRLPIGHNRWEARWAGVGWTGQPLIAEWPADVRRHMNFAAQPGPETEVIVGGLDGRVHFCDAETGKRSRPALDVPGGNPIKGTVTLDPRGVPLLYVGGGLSLPVAGYRGFSLLDFRELVCLPGRDPKAPRGWPAFDSNGLVLGDRLVVAGENGLFYSVDLHSRWDTATGTLAVEPVVHSTRTSIAGIESSLSVYGSDAYCTDNAGGVWRVNLERRKPPVRLRELGDDADSTITFDDDGSFYAGIEVDQRKQRSARGSLFKLRAPDGKLLWRWDFPAASLERAGGMQALNGGILGTPAVWPEGDLVFVTTSHHPRVNRGSLVALERATGRVRWLKQMQGYGWSSPIVVDGTVIAADATGALYVRDAVTGDTLLQDEHGAGIDRFDLGSVVEGTPVVWKGRIYLGVRGGALLCIEAAARFPASASNGVHRPQTGSAPG